MKKIYLLLMSVFVLGLSGCMDLDINDDPNNATGEVMTPDLQLPYIEHAMGRYICKPFAAKWYNHWMGYWARSGGFGSNEDVEGYAITSEFGQDSWYDGYSLLINNHLMAQKAASAGLDGYLGISKIVKAWGFSYMVDQYEKVPYSEAFTEKLTLKLDEGKDIYDSLLVELETADKLLAGTETGKNAELANCDKIFNGDLAKWRKFGNTVRLRLILRLVNVKPAAELKGMVDKIVANGAGFLGVGESAEVNPHYKNDKDKQQPFYGAYYKGVDGKLIDQYNRASEYFMALLQDHHDLRYTAFFRPVGDKDGNNYVGVRFGEENQAYKDEHKANMTSVVGGPGLAKDVSAAQWILPSFESLFLQAEAIQRGLLAGDAKAMYEKAVTESFTWLEVGRYEKPSARTGELPDWQKTSLGPILENYLRNPAFTFANWDKNENKLNLILMQKYIAMCGVNSLEVYCDYRRNNYPDIPLSVHSTRGNNVIPKRLVYPSSEYSANKANTPTVNPQTDKVFWAK